MIGAFQGIFVCLGLILKNKRLGNPYFFFLILVITLALVGKSSYSPDRYQSYPHFWYFLDIAAFLIGPLWYFTIKKSISTNDKTKPVELALLIPIMAYIAYLFYLTSFSSEAILQNEHNGGNFYFFYIFCFLVLFTNSSFLIKSHLLIKGSSWKNFPSFLRNGQHLLHLVVSVWMISFFLSFLSQNSSSINLGAYQFGFVILSIIMLSISLIAMVKVNAYNFLTQSYDTKGAIALSDAASKILQFFEEERPYVKQDFSLQKLAGQIGSNTVLTSKAINQELETSFTDLVNQHRVEHFIRLANKEENDQFTLWSLAQDSGFGNKTTFYRAFKKIKGVTPKSYLSEFQNK